MELLYISTYTHLFIIHIIAFLIQSFGSLVLELVALVSFSKLTFAYVYNAQQVRSPCNAHL